MIYSRSEICAFEVRHSVWLLNTRRDTYCKKHSARSGARSWNSRRPVTGQKVWAQEKGQPTTKPSDCPLFNLVVKFTLLHCNLSKIRRQNCRSHKTPSMNMGGGRVRPRTRVINVAIKYCICFVPDMLYKIMTSLMCVHKHANVLLSALL